MKEFIEKLIKRLEDHIKYCESCHEEFKNAKMSLTYEVQINSYKNAIEIINQLAEEYNNGWIPCSERYPEEHESIFAKLKGTDKWKSSMFEKISDVVNVTVVDGNGKGATTYANTTDGNWLCDLLRYNKTYRITAWQPLPAPYQSKEK